MVCCSVLVVFLIIYFAFVSASCDIIPKVASYFYPAKKLLPSYLGSSLKLCKGKGGSKEGGGGLENGVVRGNGGE